MELKIIGFGFLACICFVVVIAALSSWKDDALEEELKNENG